MKAWMIYGANGFLGRLIVQECVRRGYRPILAGRSDEALMELADACDLAYRVFDLQHQKIIKDQLTDVALLLNCAGPFNDTAAPLRKAALAVRCHYIDICCEYTVNTETLNHFQQARDKGCVLLAGSGFYPVAADVLVANMKKDHASASAVNLRYSAQPFFSVGAMKSFIAMLQHDQSSLQNMQLAFTLADTLACRHSSDMACRNRFIDGQVRSLALTLLLKLHPLLRFAWFRRLLLKSLQSTAQNQKYSDNHSAHISLTAELLNDSGHKLVEHNMTVAQPYAYSVTTCLMAVSHVLADKVMPGAFSAAEILDHEAVMSLAEDAQAQEDSEAIIELDVGE